MAIHKHDMIGEVYIGPRILVVEDVHETRDGIEKLLKTDGYRVSVARDEQDATKSSLLRRPDLILVSLAGRTADVILTSRRIRDDSQIGSDVPIVVFCVVAIAEGEEVAIGENVYITRPDNFNQLRRLILRLLQKSPSGSHQATILVESALPLFLRPKFAGQTGIAQDEKDKIAE